ncbi:hypothetical protein GCM10020331_091210 [Ectobacillus funiculus]
MALLFFLKRGKQDPKPGQPDKPAMSVKSTESVNNLILKKLKNSTCINKRGYNGYIRGSRSPDNKRRIERLITKKKVIKKL